MDPVAHHRAQLAGAGRAAPGRIAEATGIRLVPAAVVDGLTPAGTGSGCP